MDWRCDRPDQEVDLIKSGWTRGLFSSGDALYEATQQARLTDIDWRCAL